MTELLNKDVVHAIIGAAMEERVLIGFDLRPRNSSNGDGR
jgi:hypothetical protein